MWFKSGWWMDCVPIYVLYNVWFVCELLCALHVKCMRTVSSFLQHFVCIECMCHVHCGWTVCGLYLTVLAATALRFVCVSSRRRGGGGGGINLGGLTLTLPPLLVVALALLIVVVVDEGTRLSVVAGIAGEVDALLGIAVVILIVVVVIVLALVVVVIVVVVDDDVAVVTDDRCSSRYSQDEATRGGRGCAAAGAGVAVAVAV